MTLNLLKDILEKLKEARVFCIGDIMLDRFIYGSVSRISPEAPVPVFNVARETDTLGGAGNVLRNLSTLSVKTYFCSVVGNDVEGALIETLLNDLNQCQTNIIKDPLRKTTTKTRFIASGQQLIRADYEAVVSIEALIQDQIIAFLKEKLSEIDVIVLSDYGKGVFCEPLLRQIIALGQKNSIPVIIDPKGTNYSIYQGATLLTPNLKELKEATRLTASTEQEILKAAETLRKDYQIENILVTRGAQGMVLVSEEASPSFIQSRALEVYDVSGAGDTVVAVLSASLAVKSNYETAAFLSNVAAGIVVAKVGTAVVTVDEIWQSLQENGELFNLQEKILTRDQGAEKVTFWHRKGFKVGFTNGCFDLLHPGHLSLLVQAKSRCDRLIIGLNSDASVKRLKGPSRPIHSEIDRATILASLNVVDAVVIFDEDTPLALIQKLRPDLLVKGADYTIDKVVGAKEVISWGGEVYLANLEDGYSTTNTIKKLSA
jgi:D-beta-D-heptose 7-phosphate kinase/D-beta-D-heptose 1-phosphate adenosyltransferase